ncbi:MAG: (d)CMP kinase [Bacteroidota bacterium]
MSNQNPVIAIDGFSSCGKSTVAKALAKRLGLRYIDSGAMYRAVTLYFLRNGIPVHLDQIQNEKLSGKLDEIHLEFHLSPESGTTEIWLNGENVEEEIRSMEVSSLVSFVSAIPEVRHRMVSQQQRMRQNGGLVMDGRDIGTTVFPDADLKIFMTADPAIRAERRYKELLSKGKKATLEEVKQNLEERDREDQNRSESPLRKANDAVVLDNSSLDFDGQLEFVVNELERVAKLH